MQYGTADLPHLSSRTTLALQGLPTIRAYAAQERFRSDFLAEMDLNGSWAFAFIGTARWVGFRLDLISAAVLMATSILVMALHNKARVSFHLWTPVEYDTSFFSFCWWLDE